MIQQILKMKRGKWAVALVVIAALCVIVSISKGSTEALPGALILLAVAVVLVLSALKTVRNPVPAPTLEEQGIHVSQEALDAFSTCGTLPQVEDSPVILAPEETAVYACRADRIETKNRKLGTTGGGAGASVRVAKGVSVRTGGGGSKSVYGDVEMVHGGEFVITTHRIVFVAKSRAFEEKLSSISAVTIDGDCLEIMTSKNSYAMRLALPQYPCEIIKKCITTV